MCSSSLSTHSNEKGKPLSCWLPPKGREEGWSCWNKSTKITRALLSGNKKIIITSAGKNKAGVEVAGLLPLLQGGKSKIVKIARIGFAGT